MKQSVNLMRLNYDVVQDMWTHVLEDFGKQAVPQLDAVLAVRKDAMGPLVIRRLANGQKWDFASVQIQQPWGEYEYWLLTYTERTPIQYPAKAERFLTARQVSDEMDCRLASKGRLERDLTNPDHYAADFATEALKTKFSNVVEFRRH